MRTTEITVTTTTAERAREQVLQLAARWRATLPAGEVERRARRLALAIVDDMNHGADAAEGEAMLRAFVEAGL